MSPKDRGEEWEGQPKRNNEFMLAKYIKGSK
jgi:hypothetical protein